MASENQTASMFAGNRHILRWNDIKDEDGTSTLDLTGLIVKFSLARKGSSGPVVASPILDFRSDVSAQLTIPNPAAGNPHVEMELLPVDTATLAPGGVATVYYFELEVYQAADNNPVVVATGDLTIKANVENA